MEKWFFKKELRWDEEINRGIVEFTTRYKAQSVAIPEKILGCPHEEGIDYPEDESCP